LFLFVAEYFCCLLLILSYWFYWCFCVLVESAWSIPFSSSLFRETWIKGCWRSCLDFYCCLPNIRIMILFLINNSFIFKSFFFWRLDVFNYSQFFWISFFFYLYFFNISWFKFCWTSLSFLNFYSFYLKSIFFLLVSLDFLVVFILFINLFYIFFWVLKFCESFLDMIIDLDKYNSWSFFWCFSSLDRLSSSRLWLSRSIDFSFFYFRTLKFQIYFTMLFLCVHSYRSPCNRNLCKTRFSLLINS